MTVHQSQSSSPSTGDVERKFTDGDWHSVDSEITQAEDARTYTKIIKASSKNDSDAHTISHDSDAGFVNLGPVSEDFSDTPFVINGDVLKTIQTCRQETTSTDSRGLRDVCRCERTEGMHHQQ